MSFELDTTDMERQLAKLAKLSPEAAERGMAQAGLQLLDDAVNMAPSVPFDEGTLQGSGSLFVQNKLVATSEEHGQGKGDPNTEHSERIGRHEVKAVVGFNLVYAARLHEGEEYEFQQQKGTEGAKYLENKLVGERKEYMAIVADEVKRRLNKA